MHGTMSLKFKQCSKMTNILNVFVGAFKFASVLFLRAYSRLRGQQKIHRAAIENFLFLFRPVLANQKVIRMPKLFFSSLIIISPPPPFFLPSSFPLLAHLLTTKHQSYPVNIQLFVPIDRCN